MTEGSFDSTAQITFRVIQAEALDKITSTAGGNSLPIAIFFGPDTAISSTVFAPCSDKVCGVQKLQEAFNAVAGGTLVHCGHCPQKNT